MGLDNPRRKMSKSASSDYNWIGILDQPEVIRKKIMKAVTDSQAGLEYSHNKPALKNLINIFSLITDQQPEKIVSEYQDQGYKKFKEDLAQAVIEFLEPIQKRHAEISDQEIKKILEQGKSKAEKMARDKIKEIKEKMGIIL
jgi:tryptophanyl-tRNA synthetase